MMSLVGIKNVKCSKNCEDCELTYEKNYETMCPFVGHVSNYDEDKRHPNCPLTNDFQEETKIIETVVNGHFSRRCNNCNTNVTTVTIYTDIKYCPFCGAKIVKG